MTAWIRWSDRLVEVAGDGKFRRARLPPQLGHHLKIVQTRDRPQDQPLDDRSASVPPCRHPAHLVRPDRPAAQQIGAGVPHGNRLLEPVPGSTRNGSPGRSNERQLDALQPRARRVVGARGDVIDDGTDVDRCDRRTSRSAASRDDRGSAVQRRASMSGPGPWPCRHPAPGWSRRSKVELSLSSRKRGNSFALGNSIVSPAARSRLGPGVGRGNSPGGMYCCANSAQ